MPNTEHRHDRIEAAGPAENCLLFVDSTEPSREHAAFRNAARRRGWLVLDVELIAAHGGPWIGEAMPGSPKGCGIFAGAEARSYHARSDDRGIYLATTLDQLLWSNGVRNICLIGDAPEPFSQALRFFAVAQGYGFQEGEPVLRPDVSSERAREFVGDFASRLSPQKAALVLIDFQNDFCAPAGATARTGASMRLVNSAVRQTKELLKAAREADVFVVHVRAEYGRPWRSSSSPYRFPVAGRREPAVWTASASDASTNRWFGDDETEVCRSGTWGADFVDGLVPEPGEAVITKHRFGAFAGTGLDQLLRTRGISNLVVAGVTTNCCVETTVREAVMREFSLVVVEDCVGVKDHLEDLHRASLEAVSTYFGLVRPATAVVSEWQRLRREGKSLEP